MARAQIKLLALLEEWNEYSDPNQITKDASFPDDPTPEDVMRITKRMYEQQKACRSLGMRTRRIVLKSFNGERYLREHEQMLWIGKARHDMAHPGAPIRSRKSMAQIAKPVQLSTQPSLAKIPVEDNFQRWSVSTFVSSLAIGSTGMNPSFTTEVAASKKTNVSINEETWLKKPQPAFLNS